MTFLILNDDRLAVRTDTLRAVRELDEKDIDPRTGQFALGIPEGSVALLQTDAGSFYVKTEFDELVAALRTVTEEESR